MKMLCLQLNNVNLIVKSGIF